jgi:hypothetical protein
LTENPSTVDEIKSLIEEKDAKPLYLDGKLVGCIKRAHEFDAALTSDVMFENLVSKASAAYVLAELFAKNDIEPNDVDYLIECSEEAVVTCSNVPVVIMLRLSVKFVDVSMQLVRIRVVSVPLQLTQWLKPLLWLKLAFTPTWSFWLVDLQLN